jgi:hypothetical protein
MRISRKMRDEEEANLSYTRAFDLFPLFAMKLSDDLPSMHLINDVPILVFRGSHRGDLQDHNSICRFTRLHSAVATALVQFPGRLRIPLYHKIHKSGVSTSSMLLVIVESWTSRVRSSWETMTRWAAGGRSGVGTRANGALAAIKLQARQSFRATAAGVRPRIGYCPEVGVPWAEANCGLLDINANATQIDETSLICISNLLSYRCNTSPTFHIALTATVQRDIGLHLSSIRHNVHQDPFTHPPIHPSQTV